VFVVYRDAYVVMSFFILPLQVMWGRHTMVGGHAIFLIIVSTAGRGNTEVSGNSIRNCNNMRDLSSLEQTS
jgi:hypothetical protein